jgi:hypothetical protein
VANLQPVSITPVAKLLPVSTAPGANLPPVSSTPVANFASSSARVVDTGGNNGTNIAGFRHLKVNLKAKIYIYVIPSAQRYPNKIIIKNFLIEDFFPFATGGAL